MAESNVHITPYNVIAAPSWIREARSVKQQLAARNWKQRRLLQNVVKCLTIAGTSTTKTLQCLAHQILMSTTFLQPLVPKVPCLDSKNANIKVFALLWKIQPGWIYQSKMMFDLKWLDTAWLDLGVTWCHATWFKLAGGWENLQLIIPNAIQSAQAQHTAI